MDTQQLKKLAGRIRVWLDTLSITINHSRSLDYSASIVGLRNWPEVQAFPDRVQAVELNLAAAARLAKRVLEKYEHDADPAMLLTILRSGRIPSLGQRSESGAVTLDVLARAWRAAAADHAVVISLGHTVGLFAAALGYDSLGQYRAEANEISDLSKASYWFVDLERVRLRAAQLGLTLDESLFVACLNQAVRGRAGPTVCYSPMEFSDELQPLMDDAATNNGDIAAQMATTNCSGPFYTNLEIHPVDDALPVPGEELALDFDGTVYALEHDEAPFCGDTVNVTGIVSLTMVGRRICGAARIEVLSAELDWSWAIGDQEDANDAGQPDNGDEADEPQWISKVEALVEELNISVDQAEQIEDAEINVAETMAGVPNGRLIDLSTCPPSAVVDQLVQRHGSMEIWVFGAAFDRISPFDQM